MILRTLDAFVTTRRLPDRSKMSSTARSKASFMMTTSRSSPSLTLTVRTMPQPIPRVKARQWPPGKPLVLALQLRNVSSKTQTLTMMRILTTTTILTSPILHPQPRSKRPLLEAAESKRPQRERESQPPLCRTQMTTCLVSHRKPLSVHPLQTIKHTHIHTHTQNHSHTYTALSHLFSFVRVFFVPRPVPLQCETSPSPWSLFADVL